MRTVLLSALLITGLSLAPMAYAASTTSSGAAASTQSTTSKQSASAKQSKATPTATSSKRADCERRWRAEKQHTATHKAFVDSCVAKG